MNCFSTWKTFKIFGNRILHPIFCSQQKKIVFFQQTKRQKNFLHAKQRIMRRLLLFMNLTIYNQIICKISLSIWKLKKLFFLAPACFATHQIHSNIGFNHSLTQPFKLQLRISFSAMINQNARIFQIIQNVTQHC